MPRKPRRPSGNLTEAQASLEWFRERMRITAREWGRLEKGAEKRAFTVAGVAQLDVVYDVWRALESAIKKGESYDTFKEKVSEKLTAAWGKENPHRIETIFRTNVQKAYSAGRQHELNRPLTRAIRPYWKYSAVLDSRTSETCRPIHGTVLPASHPWWDTHVPPLHHRCRSAIIALTEQAATEQGISAEPPDSPAPPAGFGNPEKDKRWEPDLDEYPPVLVEIFRRGQ